MPQIKLEYSANTSVSINFQKLFYEIHQVVNNIVGIPINNCKSRAIKHEDYFIGDGDKKHAFAHLEIDLLEGRDSETKKKLSESVLEILKSFYLKDGNTDNLQLTVEIKEIQRDFYYKYPEGTLSKL